MIEVLVPPFPEDATKGEDNQDLADENLNINSQLGIPLVWIHIPIAHRGHGDHTEMQTLQKRRKPFFLLEDGMKCSGGLHGRSLWHIAPGGVQEKVKIGRAHV